MDLSASQARAPSVEVSSARRQEARAVIAMAHRRERRIDAVQRSEAEMKDRRDETTRA